MSMSAIDRVLSAFDVEVEPFAICEVRDGWRLRLERTGFVTVHYALSGQGTLQAGNGQEVPFGPDTIIIVPRGMAQRIGCLGARRTCRGEDAECLPPAEGLRRLRAGDGADNIVMACGRVRATYGAETGVFDLLDTAVVEPFPEGHTIHNAFQALLGELSAPGFGSKALVETLMKQCLILALRRMAEQRDTRLPWLAALADPRLALAVEAMIGHPEQGHNVEQLAAMAGMSRSAFAHHFSQAFGRSPHGFLTESRLRRAARFLETTELPVKTIAGKIGYRSRSNFSRAFKALYGVDPITFRQSGGGGARPDDTL